MASITSLKAMWPEACLVALVSHALLTSSTWSQTWLLSGAAPLSYMLIAGEVHKRRVLPWAPISVLLLLLNLAEAASATSWLFFGLFTACCWPLVGLTSLFQFDKVASLTRRALRKVLRAVYFAADTVALFNLPALEIDVDVAGLMVIRGVTLSLSSLTLVAHGIEVGIKLSDDLELALQTDIVVVKLFRKIEIGDVYGNVKGGSFEQTFAELEGDTRAEDGQVLMDMDRPLIRAAVAAAHQSEAALQREVDEAEEEAAREALEVAEAAEAAEEAERLSREENRLETSSTVEGAISTDNVDEQSAQASGTADSANDSSSRGPPLPPRPSRNATPLDEGPSDNDGQTRTTMADRMTDGRAPSEVKDPQEVLEQTTSIVGDDEHAKKVLDSRIREIQETSEVRQAEQRARRVVQRQKEKHGRSEVDLDNDRHLRAAICSQLHRKPSIQHPPLHSIRVSTLQQLSPEWLLRLFHRLPLLLRLLLNPLAYFHPITCSSMNVGASGRWMQSMLGTELFKSYADRSSDIRTLRDRAYAWLSDANFIVGLSEFTGQGLVPMNTDNDIVCRMAVEEVTLYRTVPHEATLKKAIQLGGADATVIVPSMLLPHHDHLLPSLDQQAKRESAHRQTIQRHDSAPKVVQAKRNLEQSIRDETSCQIATHVRLPAVFDQELLNFISALVKASKIIEFEHAIEQATKAEVRSFKDLKHLVNTGFKEGVKKVTVNAAANDQWIAKMVGKVTEKLQAAHGDVGYSGSITVPLKVYREAVVAGETKLLP